MPLPYKIERALTRIDEVIAKNRSIELLYITLVTILFCCGIACITVALVTNKLIWTSPSAVTTALLYWPIRQIREYRRSEIALSVAPIIIHMLPKDEAQIQLVKLLENLYGDK